VRTYSVYYRKRNTAQIYDSSNGGATAAGSTAYQVMKVDGWDAYPGTKNPHASGLVHLRPTTAVRGWYVKPTQNRLTASH
jgi:hypothetical protein